MKSRELEILKYLREPKKFSDIMYELRVGPSTLSRRIKEFMEKGLIDRVRNSEGIERYRLTKKGEGYLASAELLQGKKITKTEELAQSLKKIADGYGFSISENELIKLLLRKKADEKRG